MADQVLTGYIKRNLSRGSSIEEITQRLSNEGWSEGDIQEAVDSISTQVQTSKKASGKLWLTIIILTIAVGIAAMFGASLLLFGDTEEVARSVNMTESQYCDSMTDGVYKALCYTDLARDKNDIHICDALVNTEERKYRDICVREFAKSNLDTSLCATIENDYIEEQCIEQINEKKGL